MPDHPQPALLDQDALADWLGYRRNQTARIRAWLDARGIRYDLGRGGRVCTTTAAVNQGMLRKTDQVEFA